MKEKESEVAIFIQRTDRKADQAFPGCFVGTIHNVRSTIDSSDVVFNAKWNDTAASKACKRLFDQVSNQRGVKWANWVEKAGKAEGIDLDATHVLKVIAPLIRRALLGVGDCD